MTRFHSLSNGITVELTSVYLQLAEESSPEGVAVPQLAFQLFPSKTSFLLRHVSQENRLEGVHVGKQHS